MKWKKWLENWDMTSLKVNAAFLQMEWKPQEADKNAAWEMYIELLTRITTQPLADKDGVEATALESVHSLFGITRGVIKHYGRDCMEFTKIAIVVLNQIIRPFTAKWHKLSVEGAFSDADQCQTFREELVELQETLRSYTKMLGEMSGVESDLTTLEETEQ